MSGDAQPRKRKDKRRKKEEQVEEDFFTPLKNSTDEVIHVQKDISFGGNVVTKLIFFCILATIGVTVGIIFLEYRGSTDEDTLSAVDSPWSVTFQDWVDQVVDRHDREVEHAVEHEDHSEEHEHSNHETENHHNDEEEKGSSWLLSWLPSFGSSSEEDVNKYETEEDESTNGGLFSWFQFNNDKTSEIGWGGWFDFDGGQEVDKVKSQNEDDKYQEDFDEQIEEDDEHDGEDDDHEGEDDDHEGEDDDHEGKDDDHEGGDDDHEGGDDDHEGEDDDHEGEDDDHEGEDDDHEGEDEYPEEKNNEDEVEKDEVESSEHVANNDDSQIVEDNSEEEEEEEEDEISFKKYLKYELYKKIKHYEEEENGEQFIEEEEGNNESDQFDYEKKSSEEYGSSELNQHGKDKDSYDFFKSEKQNFQPSYYILEGDNVEDMFPEAIEALRKQAEEEKNYDKELEENYDKELEEKIEELVTEQESGDSNLEETEGMALRFGVGVALVVVAHLVLVKKWNSWASGGETGSSENIEHTEVPITEEPIRQASEEVVFKSPEPIVFDPEPIKNSKIIDNDNVDEESVDEGSPIEEEEEEESPIEEEYDEDLDIDREKFRDLIAKYGQESAESSDIEHSDDNIERVDYSEGEESPVDGGDEGVPDEVSEAEANSEDEVMSDDDLKEWTGVKESDIQIETDSEVEEEESEDESPPPPPIPLKNKGGPKEVHDEDYSNFFITNEEDWTIKEELDRADEEFNYETARTMYQSLLLKRPNSPRARYGFAKTFDNQAEKERSNTILELAVKGYKDTLEAPNITDILFIQVASRIIDRLRFRGQHLKAVPIHNSLIKKFNSTPEYRMDLAITYLMVNRLEDARLVLKELLRHWNHDPTALAHYGLILKLQGNIHGCIKYFEEGLQTAYRPLSDARLYFHFGDALTRIGRTDDALKVYDSAVALGLFRSRYQRSLYNVDHLTARPWWKHKETTYAQFLKTLESNWEKIRDEGIMALKLNGMFKDEAESLKDKGDWKQFELFARGLKKKKNCEITPFTCSLIESFEPAASCKRGQTKFSVMEEGTHVWPHCGPTNCRLRAHLGLIVPPGPKIRVANITRTWLEGKVVVFDDSFEHEVWHEGNSLRLVLIVDVWHPDLTAKEKLSLSSI